MPINILPLNKHSLDTVPNTPDANCETVTSHIKMRYILTFILLTFLTETFGQDNIRKYSLGLNLPPLIGHTIDLKIENNWKPHWTMQLGLGAMIDNKIKGSWVKESDGTMDWNNSGLFTSLGIRFNTRKEIEKNTFFVGGKLIEGYFIQHADNYENDIPFKRTGYFVAVGIETGLTIKVIKKLSMDIGFQYSPVLYSDKQASYRFSILPGIGALGNVQGIMTIKYFK
jgi:hypothetical protein